MIYLQKANTQLKNAFSRYKRATNWELTQCYSNPSQAKKDAINYCYMLEQKYQGEFGLSGKIIGYNTNFFSYGFIGEYNGVDCFFYITHTADKCCPLSTLFD